MSGRDGSFLGCHGTAVDPPVWGERLGRTDATPLADLRVSDLEDAVVPPAAQRVWRIEEVGQELWRDGEGDGWLTIEGKTALRLDVSLGWVRLRPMPEAIALQLLTTFVIPRLAQEAGAVVVHSASFAREGRAVVVCAESGGGKSSLVVAMAEHGWRVLSEDLTAISVGAAGAAVWPGPPWVRLRPDAAVPSGWHRRFIATDKTGWSLEGRMAEQPAALAGLVFLETPGGQRPAWEALASAAAVAGLARHLPWTGDPAERASRLFPAAVRLAGAAPARALRLPVSSSWAALAAEELGREL